MSELTTGTRVDLIFSYTVVKLGGTFNTDGSLVTDGVAVSIKTLSLTTEWSPDVVERAITQVHPDMLIGTWYDADNDKWEVSEAVVFHRLIDAQRIGELIGERYVFEIPTNLTYPAKTGR